MEWYTIKFKAVHKHTGRILQIEAVVASDVDPGTRPVTLKCDLIAALIRDYDLSGIADYHDVHVEPHKRQSYIISMETVGHISHKKGE